MKYRHRSDKWLKKLFHGLGPGWDGGNLFFLCPRTVCSRWWVVIKLNASRGKVGRTRAHEPYCWFGWYCCSCRMIFPVCWCGRNFELEFLQQVAGFVHVSKYGFKVTTLYEYEKNPKITVSVKHSDKKKSIPKLIQISKPWRNQSIAWQLLPVHQTIFFSVHFHFTRWRCQETPLIKSSFPAKNLNPASSKTKQKKTFPLWWL